MLAVGEYEAEKLRGSVWRSSKDKGEAKESRDRTLLL